MARRSLTQLAVDRLNPPKTGRVEYWDSHLPGFGLRISASGQKSWMAMYRIKGEREQIRETFGTLFEIPNVAEARARAFRSIEQARAGIDPRQPRKAEAAAAAGAQQHLAFEAAQSVAAIVERFLHEHAERHCRPSTVLEYRRLFLKEIVPYWGTRTLSSITKRDVNALLDKKAESYPRQANEVRKHLRVLCRWAKDEELIAVDPTDGTRLRAKSQARDRVLSDDEIKLFWRACDTLGWPFGRIAQLLLVVGQRRDEVGAMRWREVDLERRLWVIPKERAKNGKVHEVHLSDLAVTILDSLPRLGEIVFSTTGVTPPSGYSHAKGRLDRLITAYAGGQRIPAWTLHDLRRSTASHMAERGIAPHVVDRILNHVGGTIHGVAAIYNRFQYGKERKVALNMWGQHIERLTAPQRLLPDLPAAAE